MPSIYIQMKKMLMLAVLLLVAGSAFGQQHHKKVKWLEGSWTGVGYQEALKAEWDVLLECYLEGSEEIRIAYPSISCRGSWELKNANDYRAEFMETIKEEQNNCGDQVRVIVTKIGDDFVSVAFFLPEIDDAVAAYTVLTRVKPKKK
jgi:hypothetical protein